MRQQTDELLLREAPTDEHPSLPQPPRRDRPSAAVRRRPHPRYESPEEMWQWHWVRMRILLTWVLVLTVGMIVLTAGVVIFSELT